MINSNEVITTHRIFLIRGLKVMLDEDLAIIYKVKTKRLNEQLKRNLIRFPEDFCFQLTETEWENLRSQIATSSSDYGGRRYLPHVFTEHGVVMLANILKSETAALASIQLVRVFIKLREAANQYTGLQRKINQLELEFDHRFEIVFNSIRQLMQEKKPEPFMLDPNRKKIGIKSDRNKALNSNESCLTGLLEIAHASEHVSKLMS